MKFRMIGTTDENTTCDVCGKMELRSTVMLVSLDADGNADGEVTYAGSTCAGRMLTNSTGKRVTAPTVNKVAAVVRAVYAQAAQWADDFRNIDYSTFAQANTTAACRFYRESGYPTPMAQMEAWYAETLAEVATIDSGALIGTRFETSLPTL